MGEFDLIKRYFSRHKRPERQDILQSVGDDCAVLAVPHGYTLAVTTDTLVVGTHFLPTISPQDLAYKSVAVNLSDLAAMGAKPAWVSLALTLPNIDHDWLASFSQSLFELLDAHNVALIGGDTTKGDLSITLTAHGFIPQGKGLFRHNAQVGDAIFVSGSLGDSATGLELLLNQSQQAENPHHHFLLARHLRPTARVELGQALTEYSRCAIDISDGLLADLGHILSRSGCGAEIWVENLPLSDTLQQTYPIEQAELFALTGGENYELCFTVPQQAVAAVEEIAKQLNLRCSHIGKITSDMGQVRLLKNGAAYPLPTQVGFDHFAQTQ